jgi:hypothetical protein
MRDIRKNPVRFWRSANDGVGWRQVIFIVLYIIYPCQEDQISYYENRKGDIGRWDDKNGLHDSNILGKKINTQPKR